MTATTWIREKIYNWFLIIENSTFVPQTLRHLDDEVRNSSAPPQKDDVDRFCACDRRRLSFTVARHSIWPAVQPNWRRTNRAPADAEPSRVDHHIAGFPGRWTPSSRSDDADAMKLWNSRRSVGRDGDLIEQDGRRIRVDDATLIHSRRRD